MNYHQTLKEARKKRGLSQQEVADQLGYKSFTTIQKWEDGTSLPPMKVMAELIKLYELQTQDEIPVLGTIRGGTPLYATQEEILNSNSEYFHLRVVGDSMSGDRIMEGDEILVHAQSDIDNGSIGVVLIGDEATVKRVYKTEDGLLLKPSNPAYQPKLIRGDELAGVSILGEVIEIRIKV